MKSYEKPIVLENTELAEGVYMASGEAVGAGTPEADAGQAAASYKLTEKESWTGGKNYEITLTNNSDSWVDSITVTVKVNGTVTVLGCSGVPFTVNGDTLTITSTNWYQGFNANQSHTFIITINGTGELE